MLFFFLCITADKYAWKDVSELTTLDCNYSLAKEVHKFGKLNKRERERVGKKGRKARGRKGWESPML